MEILRTISLYTEGRDMPFVVIGGHAVNAYGISRQTGDLDLVVQRNRKAQWLTLMEKLHYQKGQDDHRFARFRPDTLTAWPIDLMFVDDETFAKFLEQAEEKDFGPTVALVASARHLCTLKLHALKHYQQHRFAKDYADLIALVRGGLAGLSLADLEELCRRYATTELFERLKTDLEGSKC